MGGAQEVPVLMPPPCSGGVWELPQQEVAVGPGLGKVLTGTSFPPTSRTQGLLSCWLWRVKGGSQPWWAPVPSRSPSSFGRRSFPAWTHPVAGVPTGGLWPRNSTWTGGRERGREGLRRPPTVLPGGGVGEVDRRPCGACAVSTSGRGSHCVWLRGGPALGWARGAGGVGWGQARLLTAPLPSTAISASLPPSPAPQP